MTHLSISICGQSRTAALCYKNVASDVELSYVDDTWNVIRESKLRTQYINTNGNVFDIAESKMVIVLAHGRYIISL